MTGPAQPEVEAGAMDEAALQTKEESHVQHSATDQAMLPPAPSATGQDERSRPPCSWDDGSWDDRCRSRSWDDGGSATGQALLPPAPSATGQDESSWQFWSWGDGSWDDRCRSRSWDNGSWDDSHQPSWSRRRPAAFPPGDSRLTEHRKNKRICVCDSCGIRIAFGTRTIEFDGRFVDESWRGTMPFHELYNAWKRGDIDARWWCSVCHNRRREADLDETRRVLGIAWRADSRMARAAAWRAGR